jgi:hypothetical protein
MKRPREQRLGDKRSTVRFERHAWRTTALRRSPRPHCVDDARAISHSRKTSENAAFASGSNVMRILTMSGTKFAYFSSPCAIDERISHPDETALAPS